jgi:hypothetical protein
MATILFNPEIPEAGLRFETDPQVITNLQNSAPPWVIVQQIDVPPPTAEPGFRVDAGQPVFDAVNLTYTNTWVVTELPPDYAGLHSALEGSDLMDVVGLRATPTLSLSPAGAGRTTAEIYTALNRLNDANAAERTSLQLMVTLGRLVDLYKAPAFGVPARGDNPTIVTRFQTRLTAWVNAVNFSADDRGQLRAYLLQYVPTRGYTVP